MEFIKRNRIALAIVAVIVIILVIVAGTFFNQVNNLRNTAISKETALVSQYEANKVELSTYIVQFKETMGVADAGADKLEAILVEAIKGRYDGALEPGTSGSLFSAITEAYPDLTATSASYAKVQDLVISGRNSYKNKQVKLLDMIRDYNDWRNRGIIESLIIRDFVGAPTDLLNVTVGADTFTGEAALKKISQIVLVQDAVDAYDTGIEEPLIGGDSE